MRGVLSEGAFGGEGECVGEVAFVFWVARVGDVEGEGGVVSEWIGG